MWTGPREESDGTYSSEYCWRSIWDSVYCLCYLYVGGVSMDNGWMPVMRRQKLTKDHIGKENIAVIAVMLSLGILCLIGIIIMALMGWYR